MLLSYTDKNNNTRTYSYSGSDLTAIANNFGKSISFGYTDGKLSSVTSDIGIVSYGYDANDNLVTVTKPDTTTITYI
ncbi:RHS repeat protein, partial [Staphylococcus warneri]